MNKFELARSSNTPPEVLEKLANDEEDDILDGVACNSNTPPEVLEMLVDEIWFVRLNVAQNPNTPPKVLEKLANDEDDDVRYYVAQNPNTQKYIKTYLKYNCYLNCYEQI